MEPEDSTIAVMTDGDTREELTVLAWYGEGQVYANKRSRKSSGNLLSSNY